MVGSGWQLALAELLSAVTPEFPAAALEFPAAALELAVVLAPLSSPGA
jgi:hypothetical protein